MIVWRSLPRLTLAVAVVSAFVLPAVAQKKHSGNADELYNQGIKYASLEQWPQAIEAYKQAIRLKPKFADPYNNLGNVYTRLGQYQDAIQAYHLAIQIKPDLAEAYHNLGTTYTRLGR